MKILPESCYAFAIECRFNELHFELSNGIFFLFHIHMELFSVISMRRFIHLALIRPWIPIWHRNWYRVPATKLLAPISTAFMITLYSSFSSSFKRSSCLLVLYSWGWSIRLSYGIDNSTTMILKFALDKITMSGRRLLLDIVFEWSLCQIHPNIRRFWLGTAQCFIVCLEPAYILSLSETNLWVEIVGSDFI